MIFFTNPDLFSFQIFWFYICFAVSGSVLNLLFQFLPGFFLAYPIRDSAKKVWKQLLKTHIPLSGKLPMCLYCTSSVRVSIFLVKKWEPCSVGAFWLLKINNQMWFLSSVSPCHKYPYWDSWAREYQSEESHECFKNNQQIYLCTLAICYKASVEQKRSQTKSCNIPPLGGSKTYFAMSIANLHEI